MRLFFLRTLRGMDRPLQWAGGLAVGMVAGFLPIHSLLLYFLLVLLIVSGANLLTGGCGYLAGCLVSGPLAETSEQLGHNLLVHPGLQSWWVAVSEVPLGAWCDFGNTMVTGPLALGIALAFPTFLVAWAAGTRIRRILARIFERYSMTAWMVDPERIPVSVEGT